MARHGQAGHDLAGDRFKVYKLSGVVVKGRQGAGGILKRDHPSGAMLFQAFNIGVGIQPGSTLAGQGIEVVLERV